MQTITIPLTDSFTPEQVEFIRNSALAQIETEIRNTMTIPQTEIDRVEAQVAEVKQAVEQEKAEQLAKVQPVVEVKEVV